MTFADGYIDVATRIAAFRERHPDGSLRPLDPAKPFELITAADGQQWVVVVAAAYRSNDDPAPGVGMAWEQYPGKTPFTRGSELQNAETSAWGRAIVATGAADTKEGIASRDEVTARQAERDLPPDPEWLTKLVTALREAPDPDALAHVRTEAADEVAAAPEHIKATATAAYRQAARRLGVPV